MISRTVKNIEILLAELKEQVNGIHAKLDKISDQSDDLEKKWNTLSKGTFKDKIEPK
jgi:predicted  nucleic acid-binding Zn-ribbon protein